MPKTLTDTSRRARRRPGVARGAFVLATLLAVLLQGACSMRTPGPPGERDGPGDYRDVSHVPDAVPRVEPRSRGGNPASYVVFGKRYHTLNSSKGFVERGIASWYGTKFHGRKTSNGETYDMYSMSAAHKRLPIPTYLQVTNLENGRQVIVRVNDRGPFHANRIVDLSYAAASRIGMLGKGTALVEIRAIDPTAPGKPPQPATRVASATPRPGPVLPSSVKRPATAQTDRASTLPAAPRIYLQAGAFSSDSNAQRLRRRLEAGLSRPVRVVAAESSAGPVHRVQIGPLASVEIADQVSARMPDFGVGDPLVIID